MKNSWAEIKEEEEEIPCVNDLEKLNAVYFRFLKIQMTDT